MSTAPGYLKTKIGLLVAHPVVWGLTCFCLAQPFHAAVVVDLGVVKYQNSIQTNATTVVSDSADPYGLRVFIDVSQAHGLLGAALFPPRANAQNLTQDRAGLHYTIVHSFNSATSLAQKYPADDYGLLVHDISHDIETLTLTVPDDAFPNPPTVVNFDAAQHVAPGAPFILQWNPFADSTASDMVQLQLRDTKGKVVFTTPGLAAAGAMAATNINLEMPANTLASNSIYQASLAFSRFTTSDTSLYAEAMSVVGFVSATRFTIQTFPEAVQPEPPLLSAPSRAPDGTFHFTFTAQVGVTYSIDMSADLVAWSPLGTLTATTTTIPFSDPLAAPAASPWRYYRVRASP